MKIAALNVNRICPTTARRSLMSLGAMTLRRSHRARLSAHLVIDNPRIHALFARVADMAPVPVQASNNAPAPRHDTGAVFEIFHPTGDFHFLGSKSHSGKCGCGHDYGKAKLGHRQTSIVSIGNFGL
ncbi:hypothetical protein ACT4MK_15110 [Bradyrhizobium barranii]|jgi:hypothetical protein|uniref:Uncharacterized protein n=1 Tax=Bradyrhizobium barranii subsp. barranii TaxID=2823807 RepID=A0A939S507_9BRAD|nr:hypothetical protein [Bradyrhizobium barranii]UEM16838.1 hypothetical protein J4G43_023020 [Bradyrhizobium barranii subsp. barranii]